MYFMLIGSRTVILTNAVLSLSTAHTCAADTLVFECKISFPLGQDMQTSVAMGCFKPILPPKTVMK